LPVLPPVGG